MKAKLYSHEVLIGETELSITDNFMGIVSGKLLPTDDYRQLHSTFIKRHDTAHKNFRRLNLNLQLENGCYISPSKIWVEAFEDFPDEITVYGLGVSRQIIEDYFEASPPKVFVEEPWYTLGLHQKIGLEKELLREIGDGNFSFWDKLRGKTKSHVLTEFFCSANARSSMADDVLFEIESKNADYAFAVVHLTWSGKKERFVNCPGTDFYKNFDEFKHFRMLADKGEWKS